MNIKVKPVDSYRIPLYPDMEKAAQNPELLRKLPERWRYNKSVITAIIALTSISLSGCNDNPVRSGGDNFSAAGNSETKVDSSSSEVSSRSINSSDNSNSEKSSVAPIFEHGIGTGSLGCDMVTPPTFMSEQEAMSIIKNEALKAGVNLDDIPSKFPVEPHKYNNQEGIFKDFTLGTTVDLEASDKEKGIAISYISKDESEETCEYMAATVTSYDMKRRAQDATEEWKNKKIPYAVGTFYDPGTDYEKIQEIEKSINAESDLTGDEKNEKYENEVNKMSEEDLRAQVRDFIEWLRGQGVI